MVRMQNSGKKPLAGVQIKFESSVATTSDNAGKFSLVFQDKKAGDLVFMETIRKEGYELVNKKSFEYNKISHSDQLGTDIIMAEAGKLALAKREYYDISDKQLTATYSRQRKELEQKFTQKQLDNAQYAKASQALYEEYERQQKSLDDLASRFAEVNFDDVSAEYRQALELFKAGKIDQALAVLEGTNPAAKVVKHLKEEARIQKEGKELAAWQEQNQRSFTENLDLIKLNGELYILNGQRDKAETLYWGLYALDSTDLKILWETSIFFNTNRFYLNALQIFSNIIKHPKAEEWQIANTYGFISAIYMEWGNLNNALENAELFAQKYSQLAQKYPNDTFYQEHFAISYSKLGGVYAAKGDLGKALEYFVKGNELSEKLYQLDSTNVSYITILNLFHPLLGTVYMAKGDLDKALEYFVKGNELSEKLYQLEPTNIYFSHFLESSYQTLGIVNQAKGDLDNALEYFVKGNELGEKLYQLKPTDISFVNILINSYQRLGTAYTTKGDLDKALEFFKKYNELCEKLYQLEPNSVEFTHGLAISYERLGTVNKTKGDLDKALEFFKKYNELCEKLYQLEPNSVEFTHGLAISYERLGTVNKTKGDLDKALEFFKKSTELREKLYQLEPNNVDFANGLAISYERLGTINKTKGDLDKALEFFKKSNELSEKLYQLEPNNVDFANGLAISYQHLGTVYTTKGDLDKALEFFKKYNELCEKLYQLEPNNVDFADGLAISYQHLGTIYTTKGDLDKALEFFKKYNELREKLYQLEPNNMKFRNGLALSYCYLGQTQERLKDTQKAKSYYLQGLFLYRVLVRDLPITVYQQNLQWVEDRLVTIYTTNKEYKQLLTFYKDKIPFLHTSNNATLLASNYGSIAWWALFAREFAEAEKYALLGLKTDKSQEWINTNLALAYLFQGKLDQAKEIYLRLKDKMNGNTPFKDAFLQDLKDLDAEGITHPDVEKIRELLK